MSYTRTRNNRCRLHHMALLVFLITFSLVLINLSSYESLMTFDQTGYQQHSHHDHSSLIILVQSLNVIPLSMFLFSRYYKRCFYFDYERIDEGNSFTSRTCTLPNGITVHIYRKLATGYWSTAYLTHVYNPSHHYYDIFLMKYRHQRCTQLEAEYDFLRRLNSTEVNIPSVHPIIPYHHYKYKHGSGLETCFFFMEYIPNTITLSQLFLSQTSLSFTSPSSDRGVIGFVLNCYDDIMNAVYRIYDLVDGFTNDLHERNILVDMTNHKCVLIDFERIFYLNDIWKEDTHYECAVPKRRWGCSATALYSIETIEARRQMRHRYVDVGYTEQQIMNEFVNVIIFDIKYKFVSMLVHFVLQNTRIAATQPVQVQQWNDMILNESAKYRKTEVIKPDSMMFWWCAKLKLLSYLDTDQLVNNSVDRQRFIRLLNVLESDTKSINLTCNHTEYSV
eukprot:58559_1